MQPAAREDGSKVFEINGQHASSSVFFAQGGEQIVTGDSSGVLRRRVVNDGGCEVGTAIQAGAKVSAVALSANHQWLVCGLHGSRSNVKMWNVANPTNPGKAIDMKGHTDTVTSVDISSDLTKVATGSNDTNVFIWDIATRKRLSTLWHHSPVVAVQFSPRSDRLAVAIVHASIRIYDSTHGKQLFDIPCPFFANLPSPLAWSSDGRQLYAASYNDLKHFELSQGGFKLLAEWSPPGGSSPSSIVTSQDQKFIAVADDRSLSFWDVITHEQIGEVIEHDSKICSMALSTALDFIATGEPKGKIIIRRLRRILPDCYLPAIPPVEDNGSRQLLPPLSDPSSSSGFSLVSVNDAMLDCWKRGDLARVERLLTEQIQDPSDPSHTAHALACRALVQCHLKCYEKAIQDAQKSIQCQSSAIGHIALVIARIGKGEFDSAIHTFDLAYPTSPPTAQNILLLIKAILLFEHGKHEEAMSLVDGSIRHGHDDTVQRAVKARMLFLRGGILLRDGNCEQAIELLALARDTVPTELSPQLLEILLIFGWDFDGLALAIQKDIQSHKKPFEEIGDEALKANNPQEAIKQYSAALSLKPLNTADLFVKRSKARAMLMSWDDALEDANEAITANGQNPGGYEAKYIALHALQRHDEAVDALNYLASLPERSLNEETRRLVQNLAYATKKIEEAVRSVCPFVLVEVNPDGGFLCDASERMKIFKSEPQFKELVSSMTLGLDVERIRQVVAQYFRYVTFSHVWDGSEEPSHQHVKSVKSVWKLKPSSQNNKLRKFCEMVREDGFRWAWSDTCCIDKENHDVLRESLNKMYRWYAESTATFAFLVDVNSPSTSRGLKDSKWMTRAWTSQELLAPKVIRFYDHNWKPYLGDTRANHKESPLIMQELAGAIGLAQVTIKAFNPDNLAVREKLRLVSRREATKEEDIAYSLIGIFKSDIRPHYGEGVAALGHLLADIVARLGDVSVLDWAGKLPSSYNSCLPDTLIVYEQILRTPPPMENAEMNRRVAELKRSLTRVEAMNIYHQIAQFPSVRFTNHRLQLPCVIFKVNRLHGLNLEKGQERHYRAEVSGIGDVAFLASERLPLKKPRKLIFVHPWICDLRDPPDGFTRASGVPSLSPPRHLPRTSAIDSYTHALRLLVRLQRPFRALLLLQCGHNEYRRVASEHEIAVHRLNPNINFVRDICAQVVEVL